MGRAALSAVAALLVASGCLRATSLATRLIVASCPAPELHAASPPRIAGPSFGPLSVGDIVVGVVTSGPRQLMTFAAIDRTWGQEFKHIYYFSSFNESLPAKGELRGQVRFVPTKNYYVRNSWEFMVAHKILFDEHPNASFYYICGDDAWVHVPRLVKFAGMLDPSKLLYYGEPHLCRKKQILPDGRRLSHCAGGPGYLVSNALMRAVYPHLLVPFDVMALGFSDAQMGFLLMYHLNVTCRHGPGFFNISYHEYAYRRTGHSGFHTMEELRAPIAFHYVNPEDQLILQLFYRHYSKTDHLVWTKVNLTDLEHDVRPKVNLSRIVPRALLFPEKKKEPEPLRLSKFLKKNSKQ